MSKLRFMNHYKRKVTWILPKSLKEALSKNGYTIRKSTRSRSMHLFKIKDKNKKEVFSFYIADYYKRNLHNTLLSSIKKTIKDKKWSFDYYSRREEERNDNFFAKEDKLKLKLEIFLLHELFNTLKKHH